MGTQQRNEWEARKLIIKRRTSEMLQEQAGKDLKRMEARKNTLDLACDMTLVSESSVDELKAKMKAHIVERANRIKAQRDSGRNVEMQVKELQLIHTFFEAVEDMQAEYKQFVKALANGYQKQIQYHENKVLIALAAGRQHEQSYLSTNELLKIILQ